jgi:hypothetical protein
MLARWAVLLLAASLGVSACETTADRLGGDQQDGTVEVTFVVKGDGKAMVTYGSISSTSQETVRLPWRKTIEIDGTFDVATLVAQRKGGDAGSIECRIETATGKVIKRSTAQGAYAVCDVSAG